MPAINKLNDSQIRAAKPRNSGYKLMDGGGLYVWVSPTGARSWRLAYRVAGKAQTGTLGLYPLHSLADARKWRDETKRKLARGEPLRARAAPTFESVARRYWEGRSDITPGYVTDTVARLERYVFPRFGNLPLNQVGRLDVLDALNPVDAAKKFDLVRKLRMYVDQVFVYAVEQGLCEINPAAQINPARAFGKAPEVHHAAVPLNEAQTLYAALCNENTVSALALRFIALTWVRTGELRFAKLTEFDSAANLWRIPAERMKAGLAHAVPLSPQANEVLAQLHRIRRGGDYLVHSPLRTNRPLSENAMLYLLYRMGYKDRMTGHGWRTLASTWANENGYPPDAIERQLAHTPDGAVRAAYNRAEYLQARTVLLTDWADWITGRAHSGSLSTSQPRSLPISTQ